MTRTKAVMSSISTRRCWKKRPIIVRVMNRRLIEIMAVTFQIITV